MSMQKALDQSDKLIDQVTDLVDKFYQVVKPKYLFYGLIGLHWFSTSGSVFNMINNVPPYGEKETGIEIISKEGSQQYSFEGFFAGLVTVLASLSFISAIKITHQTPFQPKKCFIRYSAGCICCYVILKMYRYKKG